MIAWCLVLGAHSPSSSPLVSTYRAEAAQHALILLRSLLNSIMSSILLHVFQSYFSMMSPLSLVVAFLRYYVFVGLIQRDNGILGTDLVLTCHMFSVCREGVIPWRWGRRGRRRRWSLCLVRRSSTFSIAFIFVVIAPLSLQVFHLVWRREVCWTLSGRRGRWWRTRGHRSLTF